MALVRVGCFVADDVVDQFDPACVDVIGAIGCIITTFTPGPGVLIAALGMVAMAGQIGGTLFIPIISRVFAGIGAYVAIALVNSMGAFAGFVSPIVTGWLVDVTANQNAGFYVMSVLLLIGGMNTIFAEAQARKVELTRATNDAAALTITVSESNVSNGDSVDSRPHPTMASGKLSITARQQRKMPDGPA